MGKEKQVAIVSKQRLCAPFVNEANKQTIRFYTHDSIRLVILDFSNSFLLLEMKNMTGINTQKHAFNREKDQHRNEESER